MTTENTEIPVEVDGEVEAPATIVIPITGEVVAQSAESEELAEVIDRLDLWKRELADVRLLIVNELAGRLDRSNDRTATIGRFKLKVNAPSVDEYDLGVLRVELDKLVAAGIIDEAVVDKIIEQPPTPPAPPPVLRKAELNKLVKTDNRIVLAAVATARTRRPQNRTLSVDAT